MLNFTVGPVMTSKVVRDVAAMQVPYFRTDEFSKIMLENEKILKKYFYAKDNSRTIFLTTSGSGAMEAAIINTLNEKDKILIIDGGSFGHRFVEICETYSLNYEVIQCTYGKTLEQSQLDNYYNKGFTCLLINMHETSTGVLYDMEMVSNFCKKNDMFLIVDSISSFLCDEFNMSELGVNIVITGSQKALAIDPGLAILCLDNIAIDRVMQNKVKSFYFDFNSYLSNGQRGQTPFTPAVGTILQLNARLRDLESNGGLESELKRIKELAEYFRNRIAKLPFTFFSNKMSNAVTSLLPKSNVSAFDIFNILKNEYNIFICPNGGELKDKVFRVGHIGCLNKNDIDVLIDAFKALEKRQII